MSNYSTEVNCKHCGEVVFIPRRTEYDIGDNLYGCLNCNTCLECDCDTCQGG